MIRKKNLMFCFLLLSAGHLLYAESVYRYEERIGDASQIYQLRVANDGEYIKVVIEENGGSVERILFLNNDLSTERCIMVTDDGERTLIRNGNVILVEETGETLKIDNSPWFGSDYCFTRFALSGEQRQQFWIIDEEDGVKPVKIQLELVGWETDPVSEENRIHFTISMPGLLSAFWKGHFWSRPGDGLIVRSEFPDFGAGMEKTVISLIGIE